MNDERDSIYKKLEKRFILRFLVECFLLGIAIGLYLYAILVILGEF